MISFRKKNKYHPLDKRIVKEFNRIRPKDKRKYLCRAPFSSLTFFHTGDILACWYNKLFPFGKYPADSIYDAWFSRRAETLRNYIKHNDLSYGCSDCRKNMNNMNFYSTGPWRYDFLPESNGEYPVSIDFQISNKCNLQCIMCNGEYSANVRIQRENQELYKNPYDENFYQQIRSFIPHLKEASFSGGEPFFAPEFFRIYDLVKEINPGITLSVTTNGTIMNDKIRSYLEAMSFNICVSLDAVNDDTYRRIRVNGDLRNVLDNIVFYDDYARKKGTTFAVKICPMRQNWRELPELVKYLDDKNISIIFNTVFFPPYCSLWNLSLKKLLEIKEHLGKSRLNGNTYTQKQNVIRYNDFVRQIELWKQEALTREEKGFEKMTVQQLSDVFIRNVENYLKGEFNNLGDDCPVQIGNIKQMVKRLVHDAPSEKTALAGMRYYASAPVDRWLSEIGIRDYEKNLDRFLQIGLTEETED